MYRQLAGGTSPDTVSSAPNMSAIVTGNILEWGDFATYGYFAPVIGREFFPAASAVGSLNSAFMIFALGFVGRVLGAYLFARQSARAGQRAALRTAILVMAISTASIGCLPTFHQIGVAAPVLLIMLRLVQGISLGGEFTTSLTYLCTVAPPAKRGLMCGILASAGTSGFLLSSALGAALTMWLPLTAVDAYGWRIPFLLGSLIAVAAFFLRGRLDTGSDRLGYLRPDHARADVTDDASAGLRTIIGCACYMFGFYLIFVYLPNGLQLHAGVDMDSALSLTSVALLLLAIACPLAGIVADRFGSTPVLLGSSLTLAIVAIPIFRILSGSASNVLTISSLALLTLLFAPIQAVTPLPFIERALRRGRGTSFSIGYNVAAVGFGGLAPIAANIAAAHDRGLGACGWLLAFTAVASATALLNDRRRAAC